MTTPGNSDLYQTFLPAYDYIPDEWPEARQFLIEHFKKNAESTNVREVGWYLDEELLSGKQFFPGISTQSNEYREIFRKVIDLGGLAAGVNPGVAHNIVFNANFTLIHMYVAATNPGGPFLAQQISGNSVTMDANFINVTSPAAFARAYCIVEYIQQL